MEITYKYKKSLDLGDEDLDVKYNNCENREMNSYFGVYKVNALIYGASMSGKTTWLHRYFDKMENIYGLIIVIAPHHTIGMEGSTWQSYIKAHESKFICYNLGDEDMPTIDEMIQFRKEICPNKKICVVLDDWINTVNKKEDLRVKEYLTQTSRASADLFCLVQDFDRVKVSLRPNFNVMILFLSGAWNVFITVTSRWFSSRSLTLDQKKLLFKMHSKIKYVPFILVNDVKSKSSMKFLEAEVRLPDEEEDDDDTTSED